MLPPVSVFVPSAWVSSSVDRLTRPTAGGTLHERDAPLVRGNLLRSGPRRAWHHRRDARAAMQRYGQVIGIKPEHVAEYERIHAAVWPGVLATIHSCNIRNYSIFRYGGLLFAYFEYVGDDYAADMARMAADPTTQE